MYYEHRKHDGSYPIVGVNTFRAPHVDEAPKTIALARSTAEEKESQLSRLAAFHQQHAGEADAALARLKGAVIRNANIFEELVRAVRVCSLGQITRTLFDVGGQYRRSM
jgi:methylmalonyl-CoA mutase